MTTENKELTEEEVDSLFSQAYTGNVPEPEVEEEPVEEVEPEVEEEEVEESPEEAPSPPEKEEETIEQIVESLPEERRDFVKKLLEDRARAEQQFRSAQGRLAAERRQRQHFEQEVNKLRSHVSGNVPQDKVVAEQAKADFEKAISEWKEVVEAEPTLAKAIDALTDAKVEEALKAMRAELAGRDEVQERRAVEESRHREMELLIEAVPNALEVIQSQEFQYWKQNVASPGLRQLADNSINHMDAISVLQQYAPWAIQLAESRNRPGDKPVAPTPEKPDTTVADQISNARQSKVSPSIRGSSPRPKVSTPLGHEFSADEAERLFAEAFKKVTNR